MKMVTSKKAAGKRSLPSRIAGVLAALACLSILFVSSASATQTHLFKETFGPVQQPTFPFGFRVGKGASALATIQSSGDLLVLSAVAEGSEKNKYLLSRFKSNGESDPFSALGTNVIDGAKGPGGLPCAEEPDSCDASPAGGFIGMGQQQQVAVDESGGPASGDIYVLESASALLDVFAADGRYLGKLNKCGGEKFSSATGLAIGPDGAVYVSDKTKGVIHKFTPTANPVVETNCSTANDIKAVQRPEFLAVGAGPTAGVLFVAKAAGPVAESSGGLFKVKLSSGEIAYPILSGLIETAEVHSGILALAVESNSGHIFVAQKGFPGYDHLDEYDASSALGATQVSTVFPSGPGGVGIGFGVTGIAIAESTGDIYLAHEADHVETYSAPVVTQPAVTTEPATDVTPSKATLHGIVDPDGQELTECAFEYVNNSNYQSNPLDPYADGGSVPCVESSASIGEGHGPVAVEAPFSESVNFRSPDYHFRLVAQNANHVRVFGRDRSFETKHIAVIEPTTAITGTTAVLKGTVNPDGSAVTGCQFEYLPAAEITKEVQTVTLTGATGGSFKLGFEGEETAGVASNATAIAVEIALNSLPAIGHVGVAGVSGGPYTVTFNSPADVPQLSADASGLAPLGAEVTVATQTQGKGLAQGAIAPCEESAEEIGEGEDAVPVHVELSGLHKGTKYEFRFTGANALDGVERTVGSSFTTQLESNVETKPASLIGGSLATLNGTVNPGGASVSECFFEYVATAGYQPSAANPYAAGSTVPCAESEAEIGTKTEPVAVHAAISGLSTASSYHFRVIADPGDIRTEGDDELLITAGPLVESEWAAAVGASEATLEAKINPRGAATTYYLEYGKAGGPFEAVTPESKPIGSGSSAVKVETHIAGLPAGADYVYRFVATSSCNGLNPSELCVYDGSEETFHTITAQQEAAQPCPNETFRGGASAKLPDCRAYEMVSPLDKNGASVTGVGAGFAQADEAGQRFTFTANGAFAGPEGAFLTSQYLATRVEGSGWQIRALNPRRSTAPLYPLGFYRSQYKAFSPDLCSGWFAQDSDLQLTEGAPEHVPNLYRNELCGVGYELLTTVAPPHWGLEVAESHYFPEPQGSSIDGTKTVFRADDALTANAVSEPSGEQTFQLYESQQGGPLRLISVLPSTSGVVGNANATNSSAGTAAESGFSTDPIRDAVSGAVSTDGSRVFWTAAINSHPIGSADGHGGGPGSLYLRVNATEPESVHDESGKCTEVSKACTYSVSGLVSSEKAQFWQGDLDGTRAIFSVEEGLKNRSLYEFEATEGPEGLETEANLIAEGFKGFMGASEDAKRVYFVSTKALAAGGVAGKNNLYLYEQGSGVRVVAMLSSADLFATGTDNENYPPSPVAGFPFNRLSRVSPDGLHAAFISTAQLTGYDSTDAASGQTDAEIYLYDAAADGGQGKLHCTSCNPSGVRPAGRELREAENGKFQYWAAGTIPGWTSQSQPTRALSANGRRLFFNSYDALLPQDTNGAEDVYEWEAPGEGSCTEESTHYFASNGGCLYLITSGKSPRDSEFFDATPEGKDVFFATLSSLLPQDNGLIDVYDARVNGGLPEPPGIPASCEGEACQGAQGAPQDPTPASSTLTGSGNLRESAGKPRCSKAKVRRKGRCVPRHQKKRHAKRTAHRHASANRRASR